MVVSHKIPPPLCNIKTPLLGDLVLVRNSVHISKHFFVPQLLIVIHAMQNIIFIFLASPTLMRITNSCLPPTFPSTA